MPTNAKNMAATLGNFISHVRPTEIRPEIRELPKLYILDGVTTMLAGVDEAASRYIRRYVTSGGGKRECSMISLTSRVRRDSGCGSLAKTAIPGAFLTTRSRAR